MRRKAHRIQDNSVKEECDVEGRPHPRLTPRRRAMLHRGDTKAMSEVLEAVHRAPHQVPDEHLTVLSIWPGIGGLDWGFRIRREFVFLGAIEPRPMHAAVYANALGSCTIADPILMDLPKADVLLSCPDLRVHPENIGWEKSDELEFKDFFRTMRDLVHRVSPRYWLVELPEQAERWIGDDPYTVFQYADLGLPQQRRRLLLGDFPIPKPLYTKREWKSAPGLRGPCPRLGTKEWAHFLGDRARANSFYGRPLSLQDVRGIQGFPDGFRTDSLDWVRKHEMMDMVCSAFPPMISKFFAAEMVEDAFGQGSRPANALPADRIYLRHPSQPWKQGVLLQGE